MRDGAIFDLPPQTVQRYLVEKRRPRVRDWREAWRRTSIPAGQILRVEIPAAGTLHWSDDGWTTFRETPASDAGLGIYAAELPTHMLRPGCTVAFTWRFADGRWREADFAVLIVG